MSQVIAASSSAQSSDIFRSARSAIAPARRRESCRRPEAFPAIDALAGFLPAAMLSVFLLAHEAIVGGSDIPSACPLGAPIGYAIPPRG
jgi:hypothetical protein